MGFPTEENIGRIAEPLDGPSITAVQQAAQAQNVAVVVGMAEAADDGRFYNTTVLVTPEGVALTYRKTHLWASDCGVFTPGDRFATALFKGIRVGLLICFDIEFPETARALGQLGAELIIITNGNMDPYGSPTEPPSPHAPWKTRPLRSWSTAWVMVMAAWSSPAAVPSSTRTASCCAKPAVASAG